VESIECAAMTDTVLFSQVGPVARITLNRPAKHNSLGEEELTALQACIDQITSATDTRVLVLTGAGEKTFCAGAALNQLGAGKISGELFQSTTDKLASLAIPTICALNGSVYGGGVELALSCDFRFGLEGTRMRVPAAQIGLCYPLSGINRFVERLGVNIAKRILVAAETFEAEELLQIGFIDHLVTRDELEARVADMADSIAGLAPLSVRAMKAILQQAAGSGINLPEAQALSRQCLESADLQEGFLAQREKRPPRFKGN
jgi:enoyl-CoA hydratase/carnithine racemase